MIIGIYNLRWRILSNYCENRKCSTGGQTEQATFIICFFDKVRSGARRGRILSAILCTETCSSCQQDAARIRIVVEHLLKSH
ncbi:hypothetical protein TNCT_390981 [Trichonephila clavata]|uniref:Uncharacterized protein n=1 Tax=Trichonephila clavata TaxID=2740835 RepID=A0A8X6HLQ6_TRICU|nr:hypothetical protein TNCT_390981 [Trichonephila clavata]